MRILLIAGKTYFLRLLMKQCASSGNLAVVTIRIRLARSEAFVQEELTGEVASTFMGPCYIVG